MMVRGNVQPVAARRARWERVLGIVEDVCVQVQLALRMMAVAAFILIMLRQCPAHVDVDMMP
jgi:hypothetical protein